MTKTFVLTKAEVRIELTTHADGESSCCAELYKFGELVEELHNGSPLEISAKVDEWLHEHQP
jgi:hypothetical protein